MRFLLNFESAMKILLNFHPVRWRYCAHLSGVDYFYVATGSENNGHSIQKSFVFRKLNGRAGK